MKSATVSPLLALVVACGSDPTLFPEPQPDTPAAGSGGGTAEGTGAGGAAVDRLGGFESGSRLRVRRWEGADGSAQQTTLFDTELGEPCTVVRYTDGSHRCVPLARSSVIYYADAECTFPLASVSRGCSPGQYASRFVPLETCGAGGTEVRTIGGVATQDTVFSLVGTQCNPAGDVGPVFDIYFLGPPLPATTFVEMTETLE